MAASQQSRSGSTTYPLLLIVLFMLPLFTAVAHAQTFTVLHEFTGGADGSRPGTNLVMDGRGNLYGTTAANPPNGFGGVFELTKHGSSWVLSTLYVFSGSDGTGPTTLIRGSDGNLYGTSSAGGGGGPCGGLGCGSAFRLTPPPTACKSVSCPWSLTVLHHFTGQADGGDPLGQLVERNGNLYGTTRFGGDTQDCPGEGGGCGVVYELSPSQGGWMETVLYTFHPEPDGTYPYGGVVFDPAGNLYGTTSNGGTFNNGTVFELSPSDSGWTETILYNFGINLGLHGKIPYGGLVRDSAGILYGPTNDGGSFNTGTIFSLAPMNGGWTENVLYSFDYIYGDGNPLFASLILDGSGNLYGTSPGEGGLPDPVQYFGNVFMMTPSNGGWNYINLYTFTGGADGGFPFSTPIMDSSGNLYGTTAEYGSGCFGGCGVVWEITP